MKPPMPKAGRPVLAPWLLVALALVLGARASLAATACLVSLASTTTISGASVAGPGCTAGPHNNIIAGTFNIAVDGGPTTLSYCVDLNNPIGYGDCVPQQSPPSYPCEVTYILNTFYPHGSVPPGLTTSQEAAAVQAAIWYFTDCFTATSPSVVVTRAAQIIAAAQAGADPNCDDPIVPQVVAISPATAINYLPGDTTHDAVATVLDTQGQPVVNTAVTITIAPGPSGPQVISGVTDANGQLAFSYANSSLTQGVDTITGEVGFSAPVGLEFKSTGKQGIVLAGEPRSGTVTGTATKSWVTARCGDGVINQASEECDDGNAVDGDGCDTNCTETRCGNGIQTGGEECDDGNLINDDGCDENCTTTRCGNGVVTPPETCDDGNLVSGDGCDSNCQPTGCGNGIQTGSEECDDGNLVDGDACEADCTLPRCGNGIRDQGEECDDWNLVSGDGCDSDCTLTACGNGIQAPPEECDDGNLTSGDGCDANCTTTRCGNGITSGSEACDDGNNVNGDACEADCTLPRCGNGIVDPLLGEQCDDGNTADGDGCSAQCKLQEICTDLEDNDADGLIDCDDPECECQVFGKDPGSIVFRPSPKLDRFRVHGRLVLDSLDSLNGKFGVLLTNQAGTIYRGLLDPGKLAPMGRGAVFRDRVAASGGGIAKVKARNKGSYLAVKVEAFGDLTSATVPLMSVQVVFGEEHARYQGVWQKRPNGWKLELPPLR